MEIQDKGVIVDGGKKIYMKGFSHYEVDKITDQEFQDIANDYEDFEAPPGPYKLQPENQGRILWISGAPGMGKSTTAQLLGRYHGYVYYEGDCFNSLKNPFIDLNADDPTMAQVKQKTLKGCIQFTKLN